MYLELPFEHTGKPAQPDNLILAREARYGDFNFSKIIWDKNIGPSTNCKESKLFIETLMQSYLIQHVFTPTRFRHNQVPSTLVLVITNEQNMIDKVNTLPPIGKSDHLVLQFRYQCYITAKQNVRELFQYGKGNYKEIKKQLTSIDWKNEFQNKNIDNSWNFFAKILLDTINKCIPKVTTKVDKRQVCKWQNKNTIKTLRKKQTAWKIYCNTSTTLNYQKYIKARNQSRWSCRKAAKSYEKNIAEHSKNNPKYFWRYVNSKLKTVSSYRIF